MKKYAIFNKWCCYNVNMQKNPSLNTKLNTKHPKDMWNKIVHPEIASGSFSVYASLDLDKAILNRILGAQEKKTKK